MAPTGTSYFSPCLIIWGIFGVEKATRDDTSQMLRLKEMVFLYENTMFGLHPVGQMVSL